MSETCHHCGYDLIGLPNTGNCPECGQYYDKHSYYRAARSSESPVARNFKWVFLAAVTLIILIAGIAIAIVSKQVASTIAITLVLAGLSGFGTYAYWSSERRERQAAD